MYVRCTLGYTPFSPTPGSQHELAGSMEALMGKWKLDQAASEGLDELMKAEVSVILLIDSSLCAGHTGGHDSKDEEL